MASLLVVHAIVALVGFLVYHQYFRKKPGPDLPPGPRPLPIVGNVMDLPPKGVPEYLHWLKFKDIYGPLSSITVLGQPVVILHDQQTAQDLLVKMSLKTASRPVFHFGRECGFEKFIGGLQYGDTFRKYRGFVHQQIGTKNLVTRFSNVLDVESRRFLLRVLEEPEDLIQHIKSEASAIILRITYGYSIEPRKHDPLVALVERMMDGFSISHTAFSWIIDIFPAVKYLPDGFPGTDFREKARKFNKITNWAADVPYSFVQQQMANGTNRASYVSSLIEQRSQHDTGKEGLDLNDEDAIKWSAAIVYGGGADTTVSVTSGFILAMLLFPEVQKKAQDEIDRVIGDRLPRSKDQERLPYVTALVKEALRWFPVTPIGTAHATEDEILYGGYRIPKGTCLLPAIWWFLHDPQRYPEPSSFEPERFLEPRNETDPRTDVFGYGRRACPGRYLAEDSLFLTISRVLATFNISKAVDEHGVDIEPKVAATPGLIAHPVDFKYSIKPRSARHADLIRSVEVEHPWEASDAPLLDGDAIKALLV